ncbi:mycofactocin biosynthesis chaperone MftB [Streptomyces sp. NPDC048279]|uniref:mycofactocin biosynthesis chaperone MftB n=1 Tax=Streptomyces sp. NPDC048279 TaxID=3154714 RepID=UPI00344AC52A
MPTASVFDLDRAWDLHPQVSVRPEPFGALLYHFGTRRLSFLKDRGLLSVVQALATAPTARAACRAVGVSEDDMLRYTRALAVLARSHMLTERHPDP